MCSILILLIYRIIGRVWISVFFELLYLKCWERNRRLMKMVYSAFESEWFIFFHFEKILVVRTHLEELHVIKCDPNSQFSIKGLILWLSRTKSTTIGYSKTVTDILTEVTGASSLFTKSTCGLCVTYRGLKYVFDHQIMCSESHCEIFPYDWYILAFLKLL